MKHVIQPIAIDLGAKYTGVYSACYSGGEAIDEIVWKFGKVYHLKNLKKGGYTLLMSDRTAKRHQRRCVDRRQLVKRLFRLIWNDHFKLGWDQYVQQTVSFLLNRRGFSFLTEEYDAEILSDVPEEVLPELPEELRVESNNLATALTEWVEDGSVEKKLRIIKEKSAQTCAKAKEDPSLKKNIWHFNVEKFSLAKTKFDNKDGSHNLKTHLHHLGYALHKINDELKSGSRHRHQYFKEVTDVLAEKKHTHGYLKIFCQKLHAGEYQPLNKETLANLLGHLSNLELKPLRKYFNDRDHSGGDYWCKARINKIFANWILREWRVDGNKNKRKAKGGECDYQVLKKELKEKWQGKILEFWLKTDPKQTVPPYQDNNNRRPPKCQSFILNSKFLDKHYPEWHVWLKDLMKLSQIQEYLDDYNKQLKNLKTSKDNFYFAEEKKLQARVLQFIFDRTKDSDLLKLNDIFSHKKKFSQYQSSDREKKEAQKNLENAIATSVLPSSLQTDRDYSDGEVFTNGTFLHLVCKYYKLRQRAKAGRIFIHPEYRQHRYRGYESTGRFDNDACLLTYCNQKSRQKRHQLLYDVAALFQISVKEFRQIISSNSDDLNDPNVEGLVVKWFDDITGLKSNADKAAKEQKDRRGSLKIDIDKIYFQGKKNDPLYKLCERAKKLHVEISRSLHKTIDEESIKHYPARSVYLLAQINNLVYKERSGNANTCVVCSMDNAQRNCTYGEAARAQRLPAISTRLIDGAVMRIARIVSNAIANDFWPKIEETIKSGNKIRIPIVTESNRFDFEENLASLKGKSAKGSKPRDSFKEKETRIRDASRGVCPYTGQMLGEGDGEIDHAIPRSSEHGVLNDEANLIYASKDGNQKKGNKIFTLKELHKNYKMKIFNTADDKKITAQIEKIYDIEKKQFTFGKYGNFLNLSENDRRNFRHALFLDEDNKVRREVINEISNRSRSFVNGTQRYFAQVLADTLHRKAKEIKREHNLSFDFFNIEARSTSKGDGISDLRRELAEKSEELRKHEKQKDKKQEAYSHLIDAQLAFAIAVDAHKKEGGLRLNTGDAVLFPCAGKDHIYDAIKVTSKDMKTSELSRKKSTEQFATHRAFTRDTFYADHYLPILLKKDDDKVSMRVGFNWRDGVDFNVKKNFVHIQKLLLFCRFTEQISTKDEQTLYEELINIDYFRNQIKNSGYCCLHIDKENLHKHWIDEYNTKSCKKRDKFFGFCYEQLRYRTEKKTLKEPEDLQKIDKKDKHTTKFDGKTIQLPFAEEWSRCRIAWETWKKENKSDGEFHNFLKSYFLRRQKKSSHQKVRKVFSLPLCTGGGKFLLRRKSWDGEDIYQIVNDAAGGENKGNTPNVPVLADDGHVEAKLAKLAKWAKSENLVTLTKNDYQDGKTIDPYAWYTVPTWKDLPCGVKKIWYRIEDITRPSVALLLREDADASEILKNNLCKPRDKGSARSEIEHAVQHGHKAIYKSSPFNKDIKNFLKNAEVDRSDEAPDNM